MSDMRHRNLTVTYNNLLCCVSVVLRTAVRRLPRTILALISTPKPLCEPRLQRWGCGAGREAAWRSGATLGSPWVGEGAGGSGP